MRISPHMQLLHHQGVFDPRDESTCLDRAHTHLLYICLYIWSTFGLLYNFIIFFGQKMCLECVFAMLMMQRDWMTNIIFAKRNNNTFLSSKAIQIGSVTGQRGQKDLSVNQNKISSKTSLCASFIEELLYFSYFKTVKTATQLARSTDNGI